jgi:hypothetical protein
LVEIIKNTFNWWNTSFSSTWKGFLLSFIEYEDQDNSPSLK